MTIYFKLCLLRQKRSDHRLADGHLIREETHHRLADGHIIREETYHRLADGHLFREETYRVLAEGLFRGKLPRQCWVFLTNIY